MKLPIFSLWEGAGGVAARLGKKNAPGEHRGLVMKKELAL